MSQIKVIFCQKNVRIPSLKIQINILPHSKDNLLNSELKSYVGMFIGVIEEVGKKGRHRQRFAMA